MGGMRLRSLAAGLRFRLALPVVAALVPTVALMFYLAAGQRRIAAREAQQSAVRMARLAAEVYERPLGEARALLTGLAQLSVIRVPNPRACSALLAGLMQRNGFVVNLGAVGPDGRVFCSAAPISGPIDLSDRAYVRRALAERHFALSNFLQGRLTGKPSIISAYPVEGAGGEPGGVVYAAFDIQALARRIAELPFQSEVSVTVVDGEGTVLARRFDHERWVGRSMADRPVFARMLREHEGLIEGPGLDGKWRLFAFTPIGARWSSSPVIVVVSIPTASVYAPVNRLTRRGLVALGVVSTLALLAALVVAELAVARQARSLVAATRRVAQGDLAARSGVRHGAGEIGQLARAFDVMTAALERLSRRNQLILDSAAEGICGLDRSGRITFANPAAQRMLGRSENLGGQVFHELVHPSPPQAGAHEPGECPLLAPARDGRVRQGERDDFLHADGSSFPVDCVAAPIREDGEVLGVALFFANLTERQRLEEQLRQAQKMEAVGSLAGGIAHDFNNLLAVILSCGSFLRDSLQDSDPRCEDVAEIIRAGQRAADLTRQLLAYSRRQVLSPVTFDLNAVLDDAEKLLRRLIGEDMELVVVRAPALAPVRADPGQLQQVILNLAVNARDAMPGGGRLTIETQNVTLSAPFGGWVMLSVSDTGTGMDAQTVSRLFEPFFTTKGLGKGTGLGLATAYGIVKQSGGDICVDSSPGKGTTFRVYLPRATDDEAQREEPAPNGDAAGGAETVLLVEDEPAVRALAARALEGCGYHVLQTGSPANAVELCRRYDGPIDLLLTDVVMPGMSGPELAARATALRPQARVLFMSGYADHPAAREDAVEMDVPFLQKPFTPQSLTRRVREVLDLPPPAASASLPAAPP